jgi:hypothetical protein
MVADLPAWVAGHDAAALRFERRAEAEVAGPFRRLVEQFGQDVAAQYVLLAGGLDKALPDGTRIAMSAAVGRALATMATEMIGELPALLERLWAAVRRALGLGVKQAAEVSKLPLITVQPSQALGVAVNGLPDAVRQQLGAAQAWAESHLPGGWNDVTVILAQASQPVRTVESTTRATVNSGINEGSAGVASAAGVGRIWVSDRDACLTCRGYAGEVVGPGEMFPAGLTLGTGKSSVKEPLVGPPAHPSCRCVTKPYLGVNRTHGVDLSTALKREAQRSVLRGDSAYDSRRARLAAADALLATGLVGTSKTAQERARRALAVGTFPDRSKARRP